MVTVCQMCEADPKIATVVCNQCDIHYCDECLKLFHPSRGQLAKHSLMKSLLDKTIIKIEDPIVADKNVNQNSQDCKPKVKILKSFETGKDCDSIIDLDDSDVIVNVPAGVEGVPTDNEVPLGFTKKICTKAKKKEKFLTGPIGNIVQLVISSSSTEVSSDDSIEVFDMAPGGISTDPSNHVEVQSDEDQNINKGNEDEQSDDDQNINKGNGDEQSDEDQNINEDEDEDDDDNVDQGGEKSKRKIPWISSGKTYSIPLELWNKLFIGGTIETSAWTYYKNKVAAHFDSIWKCMLILTHQRVGKTKMYMKGFCKHKGCRNYNFTFNRKNFVEGESPAFLVRYTQINKNHEGTYAKQMRGVLRDELKNGLKQNKAATLTRQLVQDMDDEQYLEGGNTNIVVSDCVVQKASSEMRLENDLAKDDFDDMIALQKETRDDPYIQKVISPFAVYMHSIIQYKVLEELHKRKAPGEEVVGRLDATGNVVKVTPETSTHPILYYPLLIPIKADPNDKHHMLFPVTQSLNSGHAVGNISSWISDFNEGFIKHCPTISLALDRLISDFSYANFHGVLHGFHSMRIHEYIYLCYKFAVGLTDFDHLKRITKVEMCKTHLSKTFVGFSRKFFPSPYRNKKTTYEQKFIIEVLCSMMECKSYNVLKEIFRNFCILILSTFESSSVITAKECLISLCTSDDILNGEIQSRYTFDQLVQADMDRMSECTSVYDYNESILNLPIYKSSAFYVDFKHIYDNVSDCLDVEQQEDSSVKQQPNKFHNDEILIEFMHQFSGIMPLWTALTLPKGIRRVVVTAGSEPEGVNALGAPETEAIKISDVPEQEAVKTSVASEAEALKTSEVAKQEAAEPQANNVPEQEAVKTSVASEAEALKTSEVAKQEAAEPQANNLLDENNEVEVEIKRYNNQPAESHMNIIKSLLKEKAVEMGSGKLKATRFVKLIRPIVTSIAKRYLMKIRRDRLNHGLKKHIEKDNSKVKKKIVKHIKQNAQAKKTLKNIRNKKAPDLEPAESKDECIDLTSIQHAKESWDKRQPKKKRDSYFEKKTLLSATKDVGVLKDARSLTKNNKKRSVGSNSKSVEKSKKTSSGKVTYPKKTSSKEVTSAKKTETASINVKFPNGLLKTPQHYMDADTSWPFYLAEINHNKLAIADYKTMQPGSNLSTSCMNYIFEYVMPQKYLNLTKYANQITLGVDNLDFSIVDKLCYLPVLEDDAWVLYVINTKSRTFAYVNPCHPERINSKFEFFFKFIQAYNLSEHHKVKLRADGWSKLEFEQINKVPESFDSGIYVIHAAHRFITLKTLQDEIFDSDDYRKILQTEVLQFSDNVTGFCMKCGEVEDTSTSSSIKWSMCSSCNRWMHDSCLLDDTLRNDLCPPCFSITQNNID